MKEGNKIIKYIYKKTEIFIIYLCIYFMVNLFFGKIKNETSL